jgi:hypothetical protein
MMQPTQHHKQQQKQPPQHQLPPQQRPPPQLQQLDLTHAGDGIVVAGSPIGQHEFVEAFGRNKAAVVSCTVSKLMELPLELQNQHLLLHLSCTTYLLREGPRRWLHGRLSEGCSQVHCKSRC